MSARRRTDVAGLTAYLEGEVTASERASIEAELQESAEARRTLQQLRNVSALLGDPATKLESMDLAARVRAAARTPGTGEPTTPLPRKRNPRWSLWLGAAAACLALVSVFTLRSRRGDEEDAEFRAKGNQLTISEGSRWAGIQIYRVGAGGAPERLGAHLTPSDGLSFSYTNLGAEPFRYLMIFAVDAKSQVRWYYPAYEKAGTNPQSISIGHGRANVALGELVQHDFADGTLSLFALFTSTPANVLEIEDWVAKRGRPDKESPIQGGLLQRVDTLVER